MSFYEDLSLRYADWLAHLAWRRQLAVVDLVWIGGESCPETSRINPLLFRITFEKCFFILRNG